jgi:hypothetical protein
MKPCTSPELNAVSSISVRISIAFRSFSILYSSSEERGENGVHARRDAARIAKTMKFRFMEYLPCF